jgi:hypothetical protein
MGTDGDKENVRPFDDLLVIDDALDVLNNFFEQRPTPGRQFGPIHLQL